MTLDIFQNTFSRFQDDYYCGLCVAGLERIEQSFQMFLRHQKKGSVGRPAGRKKEGKPFIT